VAEFSRAQPRPRLELNVSRVPWPPPAVEADSDLIYLALYNLLGNALKFSDPDDAILVRAFEDGRWVAVEIADSGQGIPAAEQPHVFDELYRGQLARGLPGSGLGLSLVRAIVERHGGQLSLRSRLGQGTVVTMRLPTRV
jgi:two-component system OmpR family sensor kinase